MQFQHPGWLYYGFWAVGFLASFFAFAARRKRKLLEAFADPVVIKTLISSHSYGKERLKKIFIILAMILLLITLAQPQWGEIKKEVRRKGIEVHEKSRIPPGSQ